MWKQAEEIKLGVGTGQSQLCLQTQHNPDQCSSLSRNVPVWMINYLVTLVTNLGQVPLPWSLLTYHPWAGQEICPCFSIRGYHACAQEHTYYTHTILRGLLRDRRGHAILWSHHCSCKLTVKTLNLSVVLQGSLG